MTNIFFCAIRDKIVTDFIGSHWWCQMIIYVGMIAFFFWIYDRYYRGKP